MLFLSDIPDEMYGGGSSSGAMSITSSEVTTSGEPFGPGNTVSESEDSRLIHDLNLRDRMKRMERNHRGPRLDH